jgi:ABC-type Fe3+/spermidine/putrescine transport system ATPase subunit
MTTTATDSASSGQVDRRSRDDRVPGLQLSGISKDLGGRTIVHSMDLTVPQGELICLLGPSGCGKTTTLRMIGGFLTPDAGRLTIAGRDFTYAPPEKRPTAMVFQNYALWPHMSVTGNIAFGLKIRKLSKAEIREKVDWALELVHLTHHRDTMPARISGGEQQRVALARALVLEPQVLLLDEPLSNLDAKLRIQVREDIREIQQRLGITTVLVTHDQDEALSVADRIAVMNGGRIEHNAEPTTLYSRPRTAFVASFVGAMNWIESGPSGGGIPLQDGTILPSDHLSADHGDRIGLRPEDLLPAPAGTEGTAPAEVERSIPRGHYREVVLRCGGTELRSYTALNLAEGETVGLRAGRALVYSDGELQGGEAAGAGEAQAFERRAAVQRAVASDALDSGPDSGGSGPEPDPAADRSALA